MKTIEEQFPEFFSNNEWGDWDEDNVSYRRRTYYEERLCSFDTYDERHVSFDDFYVFSGSRIA